MIKLDEMSRKAEAEFWKTHSSADYWADLEDADLEVHRSVKSPRELSRRCPTCYQALLFRYVDRDAGAGQITLHHLIEFYCRQGHIAYLASEAQKLVSVMEAVLALREEPAWRPMEMPELELVTA